MAAVLHLTITVKKPNENFTGGKEAAQSESVPEDELPPEKLQTANDGNSRDGATDRRGTG